MRKNQTLDLSFMGAYIALAVVLEYVNKLIPFLQMPQGGSINLAVIPVYLASYHLGFKKGLIVGAGWWLVGFIFGEYKYYLNPMQYTLDYFVPMLIVGLASIFPKVGRISNLYTGVFVSGIIRFLSTLVSGAIYWPPENSVAGSTLAWINSFSYNLYYNLATLIVAIILVPLVIDSLKATKYKFTFVKK